MIHLIEMISANSSLAKSPLWQAARLDDSVFELTKALGPHWVVERWSDCGGDLSIVVFSRHDPDALTTFVLFERDGVTRVATVEDDKWTTDRKFRSRRCAINSLIARAAITPEQNQTAAKRSSRHYAGLN